MIYRIIIRPQWTMLNNNPNHKWVVQRKLFGFIWLRTLDVWYTREDAEQWIQERNTNETNLHRQR